MYDTLQSYRSARLILAYQGSQSTNNHDFGYLEVFMRICITWSGVDFKGPNEACGRL
jgi:hypothetical protein